MWYTTNIVLRGQSLRFGAVTVNAWRTIVAALCFVLIFLATHRPSDLLQLPSGAVGALLAGVVLGMVVGDTLQFTAMGEIGVARAMTISSCFPLFTIGIAAVFLDEHITVRTLIGTVLVVGGVVLVALPRRAGVEATPSAHAIPGYWLGVGMSLVAALCWSLSTTLSRVAVSDIDVLTANMLRLPFSALISSLLCLWTGWTSPVQFGRRNLLQHCRHGGGWLPLPHRDRPRRGGEDGGPRCSVADLWHHWRDDFSAQAPWTARYPGDADLLRRDHPGGLSEGYREQACGSGRRV